MEEISVFTLEKHRGPYEKWPQKTRVLRNGLPLDVSIPGYVLLRQFRTYAGYLLVTDYDCIYEEAISFTLVSPELDRVICERTISAPYSTFWLEDIIWQDATRFDVTLEGSDLLFSFEIRPLHIPYFRPALGMQYRRTGAKRSRL